MSARQRIFFENLDGLRALAFGMVFVSHFFGYVATPVGSPAEQEIISRLFARGHLGVNLFFVLSGFLITYLLLAEKENSGRIHIYNFYVRRALRIWPLYFATLLLAFFIFPFASGRFDAQVVQQHLPWYLFFVNNFDLLISGFAGIGNDNAAILWSIAVEEQFYFFWPWLIAFSSKRWQLPLIALLTAASLVFRFLHAGSDSQLYFHSLSVLPDLLAGATLAWLATYSPRFLNKVRQLPRIAFAVVYLLLLATIATAQDWVPLSAATRVLERPLTAVLFAAVVAEQCFATQPFVALGRYRALGRVGVISYGLYCLHMYTIVLVQKINAQFLVEQPPRWLFYAELMAALGLSLLICYLSYRYFEAAFLKLKKRFTAIETRNV